MYSKFPFLLDGGEARLLVEALCEKNLREKGIKRDMCFILATRIDSARQEWHEQAERHIQAGGTFEIPAR